MHQPNSLRNNYYGYFILLKSCILHYSTDCERKALKIKFLRLFAQKSFGESTPVYTPISGFHLLFTIFTISAFYFPVISSSSGFHLLFPVRILVFRFSPSTSSFNFSLPFSGFYFPFLELGSRVTSSLDINLYHLVFTSRF